MTVNNNLFTSQFLLSSLGVMYKGIASFEVAVSIFGSDNLADRKDNFNQVYNSDLSLQDKIASVATAIFGSDSLYQRSIHALTSTVFALGANFFFNTAKEYEPDHSSISTLHDKLKQCPHTEKLLQQVNQRIGTITVQYNEATKTASFQNSTISLNPELSTTQKLSGLLFEYANICQKKIFDSIDSFAAQRNLSRDQYAQLIEATEFDSTTIHHDAAKQCDQENLFSPSLDSYAHFHDKRDLQTRKNDCNNIQEQSNHTNEYRKQWDQVYRQGFCLNHSTHEDCTSNQWKTPPLLAENVLKTIPKYIIEALANIPTCLDK